MDEQTAFGMAIVAARERLGWTRTELLRRIKAEGFNIHMTTLRRLESGEQEPRLSELKSLAAVLGTTVAHLMNEADGYEDTTRKHLESLRHDFTEKLKRAALTYLEFTRVANDYREAVEQAKESGWDGDELAGADILLESFDVENGPARFLVAMGDSPDLSDEELFLATARLDSLQGEGVANEQELSQPVNRARRAKKPKYIDLLERYAGTERS